jgi:nitroreductase
MEAPMDFYDVIGTRRSIRSYKPDPIPLQVLERVLEAARRSPSASNKQPWRLIVVTDQKIREQIAASGTYGKFLAQSAVIIVGVGDPVVAPARYIIDTSITLEHIVLAATAEGLGSCWVCSFDEGIVKELLEIPEDKKAVAIIALGYSGKAINVTGILNKLIRPTKKMKELVAIQRFTSDWDVKEYKQ